MELECIKFSRNIQSQKTESSPALAHMWPSAYNVYMY